MLEDFWTLLTFLLRLVRACDLRERLVTMTVYFSLFLLFSAAPVKTDGRQIIRSTKDGAFMTGLGRPPSTFQPDSIFSFLHAPYFL